jgi:hypothetical protein
MNPTHPRRPMFRAGKAPTRRGPRWAASDLSNRHPLAEPRPSPRLVGARRGSDFGENGRRARGAKRLRVVSNDSFTASRLCGFCHTANFLKHGLIDKEYLRCCDEFRCYAASRWGMGMGS